MFWNANEHSDQENIAWAGLRAIEWGRWPVFISQPLAPVFLMFFQWYWVVLGVFGLNLFWALFIRYSFSHVNLASFGSIFALLKWISCPTCAVLLFLKANYFYSFLALFWPLLIFIIGAFPTSQTERIQSNFLTKLGYHS